MMREETALEQRYRLASQIADIVEAVPAAERDRGCVIDVGTVDEYLGIQPPGGIFHEELGRELGHVLELRDIYGSLLDFIDGRTVVVFDPTPEFDDA